MTRPRGTAPLTASLWLWLWYAGKAKDPSRQTPWLSITITIQQYPDSPAHVDGPMTTQDASQHTGNASDLTPCV